MKSDKFLISTMVVEGLSFYVMMSFTPLSIDDIADVFVFGTNRRISTISDFFVVLLIRLSLFIRLEKEYIP